MECGASGTSHGELSGTAMGHDMGRTSMASDDVSGASMVHDASQSGTGMGHDVRSTSMVHDDTSGICMGHDDVWGWG